jgi:hypothetical protein
MTINVNLGDGNYAGRGNELLRKKNQYLEDLELILWKY